MSEPLPHPVAVPSPEQLRSELEQLIAGDLLGPAGGEDETLPGTGRVSDRYLVGMIAPSGTVAADASRQDDPGTDSDGEGGETDPMAAMPSLFPSSIGITFAVLADTRHLKVTASWGRYLKEEGPEPGAGGDEGKGTHWQRYPVEGSQIITLADGPAEPFWVVTDQPDVVVKGRCKKTASAWLIDLFLVNQQDTPKKNRDEAWLFQPRLSVMATDGSPVFIGRHEAVPGLPGSRDPEDQALDLLYREYVEFAVGHGTAVHCTVAAGNSSRAVRVETAVMPRYDVPRTEAPPVSAVPELAGVTLDMKTLAELDDVALAAAIRPLADAYGHWLDRQETRIDAGADGIANHLPAAREAVRKARETLARLRTGIDLLGTDTTAADAFRFANRAMYLQRVHSVAAGYRREDEALTLDGALARADVPRERSWRPFQLAFICVNLPSLTDPKHPERRKKDGLVDLLFFPTGGGKTEAYLGLTAFTLAIRRLQGMVAGHDGSGGIGVLMRYTLRLLTAQQFQRATALICACEVIRREDSEKWGDTPFRIGMWVGLSVTPNRVSDARKALDDARGTGGRQSGRVASPLQILSCPWCGTAIDAAKHARVDEDLHRVFVYCGDPMGTCPFTARQSAEGIPVVTTDEEIYRLLPGLVIATADKFAQLPWQGPLHLLFGKTARRCTRHGYRTPDLDAWVKGSWEERDKHNKTVQLPAATTVACDPLRPPDLIIQDELHLIAGPLGTLMGLYETAIDRLAEWEVDGLPVRPKIVASTATIRRAADQVNAIFWRRLAVFPPQVLDAGDSFFAVQRPVNEAPGRRYLGICAPGQRLKAVEIRVFVAALASAQRLYEQYGASVDPWMTLVGYFNALRELGGMRRLVEDDVANRLRRADRRGLGRRRNLAVRELTSRVSSSDIPGMLELLGVRHDPNASKDGPRPIDVLLATNMISVGVDVPRLGLITVVGQPKTTAEYIQATSRVGRSSEGPGLVLTIYNWARPRDLSHYESFEQYHATFYRHVEALSVTPFAARALDRGLTAVLVSLARQTQPAWNPNLTAQVVGVRSAEMADLGEEIVERAGEVTGEAQVLAEVRAQLACRYDDWVAFQGKGGVELAYRGASGAAVPLLQEPAGGPWDRWSAPTSLREVEASVNLIIDEVDPSLGAAPGFGPSAAPADTPSIDEDDEEEAGEGPPGEALRMAAGEVALSGESES
ncbi:MAG: DISARM system helicase DrmA [Dehalococcoidia bacterium]